MVQFEQLLVNLYHQVICIHSLTNVLMYAITDITTWGADMPFMVGHVRTRAYLYIFKLICFSWWEL